LNLITETKKKLDYHYDNLKNLRECQKESLSIDAQRYILSEIDVANKYIQYYSEILKKLEEK
jgi:hypothetical protein